MKLFINLFITNMKHAIISYRFLLCVCLVALTILMTIMVVIHPDNDVLYLLSLGLGGSHGNLMLIMGTLPILPFAITFATDWQQKATSFWLVRTGVIQYSISKIIVSALSAFLVTFIGLTLFVIILSFRFPLFSGELYGGGAYQILLDHDNPYLYFIFTATHIALTSAMFGIIALWVSTMIPNKFVTVAAPAVIYFITHRFTTTLDIPTYLKALTIVEGTYDAGTPILSLLLKLATVVVIITPLAYLSVRNIRRRVQLD